MSDSILMAEWGQSDGTWGFNVLVALSVFCFTCSKKKNIQDLSVGFDGLKLTTWLSTLSTVEHLPWPFCVLGLLGKCEENSCIQCFSNCGQAIIQAMRCVCPFVLLRGWHIWWSWVGLKTPKRNKYWPVLLLKVDTHSPNSPHHKRLGKNSKMTLQIIKCHHIWTLSQWESQRWCHVEACPTLCPTPSNMLTFVAQLDTGNIQQWLLL